MNTLNVIGYSVSYSEILIVLFAEVPDAPPTPTYLSRHGGNPTTGLTPFITIKWTAPINNGGSPILGFKIESA